MFLLLSGAMATSYYSWTNHLDDITKVGESVALLERLFPCAIHIYDLYSYAIN